MRCFPSPGIGFMASALMILPAMAPGTVYGQCEANETAELHAPGGEEGDYFGRHVALFDDLAVIGAPYHAANALGSGAAFVYHFDGAAWALEAELAASDGGEWDLFGSSVAIFGNAVLIGAPSAEHSGFCFGAAYVFRLDGSVWVEEAKLAAGGMQEDDWFGDSVAIAGDVAVVGAPKDDDNGNLSGSAYIFRFDGAEWTAEAKLLASDGAEMDYFGSFVALAEDLALIGAHGDGDNGSNSGSAYVFRYDGSIWIEETKLLASDGQELDRFGCSVALGEDTALIGAFGARHTGVACGAAYVFRYDGSTWTEQDKLMAHDGGDGDCFGYEVDLSGDIVVVGAPHDDNGGDSTGSAYAFGFDGSIWTEQARFVASDAAPGNVFGWSVAAWGEHALVGAPGDDDLANNAGAAYTVRGLGDCNTNGALDICDITGATSPDVNGNGIPDECECLADVSGDATVNVLDLLLVLAAWGQSGVPEDINGDGVVNVLDLLEVLGQWGPCA